MNIILRIKKFSPAPVLSSSWIQTLSSQNTLSLSFAQDNKSSTTLMQNNKQTYDYTSHLYGVRLQTKGQRTMNEWEQAFSNSIYIYIYIYTIYTMLYILYISSCSGRIRFDSCSLYPQNEIGPSISSSVVLCVFVLWFIL